MTSSELRWPVQRQDRDGDTYVSFQGTDVSLDETATEAVSRELDRLVEEHGRGPFRLDLANVRYLNSSTLGMLLVLHKKLHRQGRTLVLSNPQPYIAEMLAITNLDRVFDIHCDRAGSTPA